jgi:hypothetical protein
MEKDENGSEEVDASTDNPPVDASGDGKSDNADNTSKNQEKEDVDLEDLKYKERYAQSTKEMQKIKSDPAKLREFLGLDADASLDEHFGTKKAEEEDKEEEEEKDEEKEESKDEISNEDSLPYDRMKVKAEEQAAIDLVWDNFAEKHPDIEKPKVRDMLTKNFFRFLTDEAGNRRKLKNALEDTYKFISLDETIKKAQDQGRNEGIIKSTQNNSGAIQSSSSKPVKSQPKNVLSSSEKAVAEKLGVSPEDYMKNKIEEEDED